MKKLSWYKKIPWVKLLIAVVVVIVFVFVLDSLNQSPPKPANNMEEKLQSVSTKQVAQTDLVIYKKYYGYVEDSIVQIGADRVQGKIKSVCVSKGDEVKRGSTLFTLDVSTDLSNLDLQMNEINNAKESIDLEINQLTPQLNKLKDLYDNGMIAFTEYEQPKNQLKKLELQRKQLNEKQESLNKTIVNSKNQTKVLSPIDGKVEEVKIISGTYIGQSDFIKIKKKQLPTCIIMVDETDIDKFVVDEKIKAVIANKDYQARIKAIKSRDQQQLLFPVEIELDTQEPLLTGRTVKVLHQVYYKQKATMIPRLAVIKFADQSYVYVLNKNQTVSKKNVILGKSKGEMVEIIKGLSAGDKVVVEGQFSISEGQKVTTVLQ